MSDLPECPEPAGMFHGSFADWLEIAAEDTATLLGPGYQNDIDKFGCELTADVYRKVDELDGVRMHRKKLSGWDARFAQIFAVSICGPLPEEQINWSRLAEVWNEESEEAKAAAAGKGDPED